MRCATSSALFLCILAAATAPAASFRAAGVLRAAGQGAGARALRMSTPAGGPDPNAPRFIGGEGGPAPAGKSKCQRIQFKLNGPVVEMEVFGVQGDECLKLTQSIEEALGTVVYREDKPERWQKVEVEESNTLFDKKYSEW